MKNTKQLYDKMVDFKNYAIILLAVSAFFYLGVIIPSETKEMTDLYMLMGTSTLLLSGSILFFFLSKKIQKQLDETEDQEKIL